MADALASYISNYKFQFKLNLKIENRKFVLVIAWFRVQLTINLTSGNLGPS